MAGLLDLETDAKALATGLGYTVVASWADRPAAWTTQRAYVRITDTEQLQVGSNLLVRTAQVEIRFGRRLAPLQTYQALADQATADLQNATRLDLWTAMASTRQSPVPEVEVTEELEKVGQVIFFAVRARVALEG
jgi:hypothetical protein